MPDHPGNNGPTVCQRAIPPAAPSVPTNPGARPRLLDRVRQVVRTLHYSPRTEQAYIYWIRRFIFHNGVRHPEQMGAEEVGAFLSHLAVKEHVGASTHPGPGLGGGSGALVAAQLLEPPLPSRIAARFRR